MKPSGRDRLIIALDVRTRAEAIPLALTLAPFAAWMKIGLQLFTAEGPDLVRAIRETGAKIFLDLKVHDIPNTAARAVESAAELDVQMLTLHLCGGSEMIRAAPLPAKRSTTMTRDSAMPPHAPTPWMTRAPSSISTELAAAAISDPST